MIILDLTGLMSDLADLCIHEDEKVQTKAEIFTKLEATTHNLNEIKKFIKTYKIKQD